MRRPCLPGKPSHGKLSIFLDWFLSMRRFFADWTERSNCNCEPVYDPDFNLTALYRPFDSLLQRGNELFEISTNVLLKNRGMTSSKEWKQKLSWKNEGYCDDWNFENWLKMLSFDWRNLEIFFCKFFPRVTIIDIGAKEDLWLHATKPRLREATDGETEVVGIARLRLARRPLLQRTAQFFHTCAIRRLHLPMQN